MKKRILYAILLIIILACTILPGIWAALRKGEPNTESSSIGDVISVSHESAPLASVPEVQTPLPTVSEPDDFIDTESIVPPTIEENDVVWVFSEVADFFIDEEGCDPTYTVDWVQKTAKRHNYKLILDVDPQKYLQEKKKRAAESE